MERVPSLAALRPFVDVDTLRVLARPGGLQYARSTWRRLTGAEPPTNTPEAHVVVERLNTLCSQFRDPRYLEIGVFLGSTFLAVEAFDKVGVDPKPRFSVPASQAGSTHLFRQTSDQYFEANRGAEFDVIFLDGLHTYEQTWRDFLNSLSHAHDRTFWLIDDVVPSSRFAAMPDEAEARRAAQQAGVQTDGDWQGDVFKIVVAISRTFPEFEFSTLVGAGKEQLLVWLPDGRPVPRVRPQAWGLRIEESYGDLFLDGEIPGSFNPLPDEAAFELAIDHLPVAGSRA